jgi:oligoribonuclease NrnB/cAMP/cGMP phosphodiesterase (DHH superfamily)
MNTESKKGLCIYHGGGCLDGFTSAWVVHEQFGEDLEYHPGVYQEAPPDVAGRNVLLVDFSYKRDVILKMLINGAKSIIILDHHESAVRELQPLLDDEVIDGILDTKKSGCRLTWEWFNGASTSVPEILLRVEDRDLFRFQYEDTNEVVAALASYPQDFETWSVLMKDPTPEMDLSDEGRHILRKHHKEVHDAVNDPSRRLTLTIGEYTVPAINAPHTQASDIGHELAKGAPFGVVFHLTADGGVSFSLRSEKGSGTDVSLIAEQFGGGGHRNAAGFKSSLDVLCGFMGHGLMGCGL